jgi:putative transposase
MPRQTRLDLSGALHHITARGINQANLVYDDEDKTQFIERLLQKVQREGGSFMLGP